MHAIHFLEPGQTCDELSSQGEVSCFAEDGIEHRTGGKMRLGVREGGAEVCGQGEGVGGHDEGRAGGVEAMEGDEVGGSARGAGEVGEDESFVADDGVGGAVGGAFDGEDLGMVRFERGGWRC